MSQFKNVLSDRQTAQYLNEEFFDLHPRPYDVEYFQFENDRITLYLDKRNTETWLVKIRFTNWQKAEQVSNRLSRIFDNTEIDCYRNHKYLFLRKMLF